ncbi:MAG: PhnD/SsuA/transferrin family substrate-binding protein [Gemmataceae bacterium]|nr:PhnD/SsuA/transferrin family substrate-binding protein [Gemmataceae bacterium]
MPSAPLRFATFLAPNMLPVYRFIAHRVGEQLDCRTELVVGSDYDQLSAETDIDLAFVCGLPYVELARRPGAALKPLAAPVLAGERYGGRPVYFSDVIVHRDSPHRSFAELRGCSWSYNEPQSHSGYGLTRYWLARLGETRGFFGRVIQAGFHERSIRLVASREVDASAIDSQVLAVALRDHPELAAHVRVVATLGPSTIQPVVATGRLSGSLLEEIRSVLLGLGDDSEGRRQLAHGLIESLVAVDDADYDDIRAMLAVAEAADFLTLR